MRFNIAPRHNIWIAAVLIIIGVMLIAFVSQHVVVSKTVAAFNRQQLVLVREAAKGVEELARNTEMTLRIAADMLGTYPRERVFASLVANRQEMLHQLFLVDSRGAVVYSYPEGTAAVPGSALDMSEVIGRASRSGASVLITDFVSFQSGGQRNLSFVLGVPVPGQSAWVCCIPNA
ncbi:MAG: hypothetical protein GY868_08450, partial [Deltaproteobacteria bacterium]|nr:hypothetical protein [Deltaproteobacteria bacterium]